MYKLVLEESLKDDSCVILCGKHAYANMVKHGVPVEKPTMNRRWFIMVQRKLSLRRLYICMHHKRAVTVPERYRKTEFPCYEEAEEIATALLDTGNFQDVWVVEAMEPRYEE